MFRSLAHGKRVVNGLSGFVPAPLRDLSQLLSAPDAPFPAAAQAALQRIYPLRYLVVRLTDHHLAHAWQPTWQRLRRTPPPFLRHRGTYGGDDLYEILPVPEQGLALERWVSYDFLVAHPLLETSVRPIARRPGRAAWVELTLNDRRLTRVPLDRPRLLRHRLEPPYHRAAPNAGSKWTPAPLARGECAPRTSWRRPRGIRAREQLVRSPRGGLESPVGGGQLPRLLSKRPRAPGARPRSPRIQIVRRTRSVVEAVGIEPTSEEHQLGAATPIARELYGCRPVTAPTGGIREGPACAISRPGTQASPERQPPVI